jgi:membrane-associated phospholipid phosphatase
MIGLQRWLASLAATAVAATTAYLWLDRPIAFLAHANGVHQSTFARFTHIPDPMIPLGIVCFVVVGLAAIAARPLPKIAIVAALCGISVVMAEATKNQLKFVFGRTWPDTWINNNPSLIHDGVYGFNLFHGGDAYASFPSGHTTVTCALVSVLWVLYPQFRAVYALAVLAVVAGLLGANYHFLSDIIAGGFVGVSTGWMTLALWHMRQS